MELIIKGETVWIDDEDYDLVKDYTWQIDKDGYIYVLKWDPSIKKKKNIRMHRLIMGVLNDPSIFIDHEDRNKKNNRKSNLRLVTNLENMWNRTVSKRSTSGYLGVFYNKNMNMWRADITVKGEGINLGFFYNKEDAAKARDYAAIQYHKEYASLNFPDFDYSNYDPSPDIKRKGSSSQPGVNFVKSTQRWVARITKNGKRIHLGSFSTEDEAIAAYKKAEAPE